MRAAVEGKAALAEQQQQSDDDDQEEKGEEASAATKTPVAAPPAGFLLQALAIVRTKKWQVYQGHVSTQIALGGSNFVYFFWCATSVNRYCR